MMTALKTIRFFRGIQQQDLAVKADLDPAVVSRIENGRVRPTPAVKEAQRRIAQVLEMSVETLFPGEPK